MNALKLILTRLRYFAPAWVFASLNIMTGTWVLYIPEIKNKLAIDDGQLGIALFCFALGTLTLIPFASRIISKAGVGRATAVGVVFYALIFLLPVLANNYFLLCVSLFLTGGASGFTDIAMNALVSDIEQEDEVSFMSASHGFFSLGGVLGAGIGSLLILNFRIPFIHMLYAAIFVVLTNLLVCKAYIKIRSREVEREKNPFQFKLLRPLVGLMIIALIIMGSEGAIEHWSKLYLLDIVQVSSEKTAGFGFVAFSATMTTGRFLGDMVSKNYGAFKIIIAGCLIAMLGYGFVLTEALYFSLFGFGMVGLGFSVIIPELFRLAGKTDGVSSSEGISFVAGFGYIGFLSGPVILGFLSELSSLRLSFSALLVAAAIAMITTFMIRKRK
ncbi:MFS transporter [Leptobacterium flavescens]|uniref:MFS transporter n=1 Tax=Leptobacterium flavescens TaxID=472055 RepID=A0A6P0UGH8_9FLAO|nr:MFS transporter [Leptobacterium flavescens]NER12391.1 MFS transporter [Leptobacterium flavescens]